MALAKLKQANPRIALVTGASSGVGKEFCIQIDQRYADIDEIWMVARREDRLLDQEKEISKPCEIFPLDLLDPRSDQVILDRINERGATVGILVNSAGLGKTGRFDAVDYSDSQRMIDLNITSLSRMTNLLLPFMKEGAKILNIASVAAFLPQPNFAVYAASKSYVVSLSRALNVELKDQGITVCAVCPNPMNTEFFELADPDAGKKYIKELGVEDVDKMVSTALKNVDKGKDTSLSCVAARLLFFASRIFPHRFIFWVESKLGLF